MRLACSMLPLLVSLAAPASAQTKTAVDLDFLAGDWTINDPSGASGRSHIVVQQPKAMLFEVREVGSGPPQPLWFEYAERSHGWMQLFLGPNGIREFPLLSPSDAWPLVFGADVVLKDATPVRFRLTFSRSSNDETRRVLEMSRDKGASWTTVFDYAYRRVAADEK